MKSPYLKTLTFLFILLLSFSLNAQITYTVNTTNYTAACNGNDCGLREAINKAEIDGEESIIKFDIPGTGPHTIAVTDQIIINNDDLTIDGLSQTGNNPMAEKITLDFIQATEVMIINGSNVKIYGLKFINGFAYFLYISGSNIQIYDNVLDSPLMQELSHWTSFECGILISTASLGNIKIENNVFFNCYYAIRTYAAGVYISKNIMSCNTIPIYGNINDVNDFQSTSIPIITEASLTSIVGTAQPNHVIEVFIDDNPDCQNNYTCQGYTYLGTTTTDNLGDWILPGSFPLATYDILTATATDSIQGTSSFSDCFTILNDLCFSAIDLAVETEPCSTVGIILNLEQMTDSNANSTSSCYSNTYQGNDAWFKLTIPSTGNALIRTNIENTVVPVIELYEITPSTTCDNLSSSPIECAILDSLPYAMVLDEYESGDQFYVRVWDKDNTIVDSDNVALLHMTVHELPVLEDDWDLCDQDIDLTDNPTILCEKGANTFIIQYDTSTTEAEILLEESEMISEGLEKKDECICNNVKLQLWDAKNPIIMEEKKRAKLNRARVDTTNYNYIFEAGEFQVNAYAVGEQYDTNIAMDSEGNFVVVWVDRQRGHSYGRVYNSSGNPITSEIQLGDANGNQYAPSVFMNDDGSFITAWHEKETPSTSAMIWVSMHDKEGVSWETSFISNGDFTLLEDSSPNYTILPTGRSNPDISGDGLGKYVMTWHTEDYVIVELMGVGGPGLETLVSLASGSRCNPNPSVSMNSSGNFIVVWNEQDADKLGVYAQRYNLIDPTPVYSVNSLGDKFLVNTYTSNDQKNPTVHLSDDGTFTIVWQSYEQAGTGSDYDIYAQRYDANANPIGGEFRVNTHTLDTQQSPSISILDDGTFFIAWSSFGQDGDEEGIFGQSYDSNGIPNQGEFQVNAYAEHGQGNPNVVTNGNTIIMAAWEDGGNDGYDKGIFGQRYEVINTGNDFYLHPVGENLPATLLGDSLNFISNYSPTDSLSNVRVAIIDTGVNRTHNELNNAIWNNTQVTDNCYVGDNHGFDFLNETGDITDIDNHGTKVNGALIRDFGSGVQLELMNLKFFDGKGYVFDAICGIYYAVDNGADILNLSWGFEATEYPSILKDALQYASDHDVLIVTSAGNTSKDNDRICKFPANLDIPNMIVVTSYESKAATNSIKLANYASYGQTNVDIAALGFLETPAIGSSDKMESSAGTSLAAPLVSRTAAIIKGLYPNLSASEIKDCILNSAQSVPSLIDKVLTGGILDHEAALDCAATKAGNCTAIDLEISQTQNQDKIYKTDAWIVSDATINNNSDIEYRAAEYISLDENFEVILGTEFLAIIDDCDPTSTPTNLTEEEIEKNKSNFRIREKSVTSGKVKIQFNASSSGKIKLRLFRLKDNLAIDEEVLTIKEKGWYEKIIDINKLLSDDYIIQYENTKGEVFNHQIQIQ